MSSLHPVSYRCQVKWANDPIISSKGRQILQSVTPFHNLVEKVLIHLYNPPVRPPPYSPPLEASKTPRGEEVSRGGAENGSTGAPHGESAGVGALLAPACHASCAFKHFALVAKLLRSVSSCNRSYKVDWPPCPPASAPFARTHLQQPTQHDYYLTVGYACEGGGSEWW